MYTTILPSEVTTSTGVTWPPFSQMSAIFLNTSKCAANSLVGTFSANSLFSRVITVAAAEYFSHR